MSGWDTFDLLSTDTPTSITWASRGNDGCGKSYFACTAPGPIFIAGFDVHGMRRVDPTIREGKDIRIGQYGFAHLKADDSMTRDAKKQAAAAIWNKFTDDYQTALKHARTIIWDREDLAWELLRYASFGGEKNEGSRTGQLDYGDLNSEYVGLIQLAATNGVNLGLLQGLTEKWISKFNPQKATMERHNSGELIPDGFKKVADHVDITIDHFWEPSEKAYKARLVKFPNKDFKGEAFADLSFPMMATLAFPSTTAEDWV